MPQNLASATPEITKFYSVVIATHQHYKTGAESCKMQQSRWSSSTKPNELKSAMASAYGIRDGSFGVLLPVCLLAVFLSCVVCVYHWQGTRERKLDMEDDRKRKRTLSEFDSGCALKSHKRAHKNKVHQYPWKTTSFRIQELPDINNNDGFEIPLTYPSGRYYGDSSLFSGSAAVGQRSGFPQRPILKRTANSNKTGRTIEDLSGFSYSSEAQFDLSLPSSWSADITEEDCPIVPKEKEKAGMKHETGCDVINEDSIHVIYSGDGQIVSVETINGSLLEYWV